MELEVGMYVRTKFGVIDKCISTSVDYSKALIQCETREISKHQIVKTGCSIIDILEVGDYVNGEKVFEVLIDRNMSRVKTELSTFFESDIKSIVTKEAFESMSYKVED